MRMFESFDSSGQSSVFGSNRSLDQNTGTRPARYFEKKGSCQGDAAKGGECRK